MAEDQSVTADAEASLAAEETFELPDRASASVPEFLGSTFAGAPPSRAHAGVPDDTRRTSSRRHEPKTLEDLYCLYPKIGQGDWKIRVERISPTSYGGISIAGVLGDYYEPMPMDEFRRKFGGGHYSVMVLAPDDRGEGPSHYRMMKAIKIRVPGKPLMAGLDDEADSNMAQDRMEMGMYNKPLFIPQTDPPEVRLEKMRMEERERERERKRADELQERLHSARQLPDGTLEGIRQTGAVALEETRESHRHTLSLYAEELDRMRAELRNKDDQLRESNRQLVEAQQQAANTSRHIETEALRQQKEFHTQTTNEQRDRYEAEIRRLREAYDDRISTLTQQHLTERANYESTQQLERERIREEYRSRADALEQAQKREIESLQRQHDARVEDIKRTHESQITLVRERCDREVSAIRESERTQAAFAKETATNREQLMRERCERLEKELADEKRKSEDLFRKLNKPMMEQLNEASNTARMIGMVHPSEVEQTGSETTLQQIFGLGKSIAENAPKVLEKIAEQRMQGIPPQHVPMHVQRMPQLPPQQQRQVHPSPPMQHPQHPQHPPQHPQHPPQQRPQPPPQQRPQPPPQPQRPIPGTTHPGMPLGSGEEPSVTPPPLSGTEPAQPAVDSVEEQDEGNFLGGKFPREKIGELYNSLEMAVQTNLIGPDAFAGQLVEQLGIDLSRQLLQQFTPQDVIEGIRQTEGGESTAIMTRDGQIFVADVFGHAARIVTDADQAVIDQAEAMAAEEASQQPVAMPPEQLTDVMGPSGPIQWVGQQPSEPEVSDGMSEVEADALEPESEVEADGDSRSEVEADALEPESEVEADGDSRSEVEDEVNSGEG